MAEVPKDAEFSFIHVPGAPIAARQGFPPETVVSLQDPEFFSQGVLSLPISKDETGPVLMIDGDLTIGTSAMTYRIANFWSAFETDTLKSISLSDGSTYTPIDFIETFAGPDLLEQVIYSIDTSSAGDTFFSDVEGVLDMRDLTEVEIGLLEAASSSGVGSTSVAYSFAPLEPGLSLNRLFIETETEFGG